MKIIHPIGAARQFDHAVHDGDLKIPLGISKQYSYIDAFRLMYEYCKSKFPAGWKVRKVVKRREGE